MAPDQEKNLISKSVQLTGHNASIFALAQGREDFCFLSAAGDGWIVEWDMNHPDPGKLLAKAGKQIFSLWYSTQHDYIIAGDMDGGVHWIDPRHPDRSRDIAHHQKGVFAICESGRHIFTAGGDGQLTKWCGENAKPIESVFLSHLSIRSLCYCPLRNELSVGSSDCNIYLLDAETLTLKNQLSKAHGNSVFALRYSPDARLLLSGGRDAILRVWDLSKIGKPILEISAHWFTINDIAFHPNGMFFATASRDKTLKIWNAETFDLIKVLETARDGGHLNSVNTLLWSDYCHQLISGSDDRSIIIWNTSLTPAK